MKVNKIFQDGCILQRKKKIPVWGEAENGCEITVIFSGQEKSTRAVGGKWYVELEPVDVLRNETMIIRSKDQEICIEDISVGEVWLAAGQSNMELWMHYDKDLPEILSEDLSRMEIRFYDCAEVSYDEAYEDWDYSRYEIWRKCTKEDIEYYSATAFWFAKKLYENLGIPIGTVGCNYGGSNACCWMDEETVKKHGQVWLDEYNQAIDGLDIEKYKKEFRSNPFNALHTEPFSEINEMLTWAEDQKGIAEYFKNVVMSPMGPYDAWRPCGLYNTMLEQVIPYSIAGVLWYQGESDDVHAEIYGEILKDLIQLWRKKWKEELPFLIVQLAPFDHMNGGLTGEKYPIIRAGQKKVTETVEKTWLVSTSDCGEEFDIHPKHKKKVGERLALQALAHLYGKKEISEAPECILCEVDGTEIILTFSNSGDGLQVCGDDLSWLEIKQSGKSLPWTLMKTDKDKMVLDCPGINERDNIDINIAQTSYYQVNLYNSAWIPVIPAHITVNFGQN